MKKPASYWRPIKTCRAKGHMQKVDLWLHIFASPRSMGWSDSFRVIDAWRIDSRWFHYHNGKEMELVGDYVTHWAPVPKRPALTSQERGGS